MKTSLSILELLHVIGKVPVNLNDFFIQVFITDNFPKGLNHTISELSN